MSDKGIHIEENHKMMWQRERERETLATSRRDLQRNNEAGPEL